MTTAVEPLRISTIEPDRLYTLRQLCEVFPSRRGGRLSYDVARRWARAGKIKGMQNNKLPGDTRDRWQILGADLLECLKLHTTPRERIESPAKRRKREAEEQEHKLREMHARSQRLCNTLGRKFHDKVLGVVFYPQKPEAK